ncbi:MAG: acyltransferase [bacterium]|nr:acyltransferase [bacterium]
MAIKQLETAQRLAAATPQTRNRYVDFLRAAAILAVVVGHWLMAAVWIDESGFHTQNVLAAIEATQWLTWILQVMPVFFLVGGFSNATSWERSSDEYASWLRGRLQRLVGPTLPLIGLWTGIALIGPQVGLDTQLARIGSQVALVPLWFLAVYVLMVAATPATTRVWNRRGGRAVVILSIAALAVDGLRAATSVHVGYANYVFVWGAIYLLGHAWFHGFFESLRSSVTLGIVGGVTLVTMTIAGPYDVSMVGVPGVEFGNTAPPSAALLALGFAQIGFALTLQGPMRRLLSRPAAWTATVMVNGSIMTLYVWHMTAMALTIGLLKLTQSPLLDYAPGSGLQWWASRPLWIGVLTVATLPFLMGFRRFESSSRSGERRPPSTTAALAATAAGCVAFGAVAFHGLTLARPMWALAAVAPLLPLARWLRPQPAANQRLQELPGR